MSVNFLSQAAALVRSSWLQNVLAVRTSAQDPARLNYVRIIRPGATTNDAQYYPSLGAAPPAGFQAFLLKMGLDWLVLSHTSHAVARTAERVHVVNATTPTPFLTIVIPAGYLGVDRAIRVSCWGTVRNGSGGTETLRLRGELTDSLGTDTWQSSTAMTTDPDFVPWFLECFIPNVNLVNRQRVHQHYLAGFPDTYNPDGNASDCVSALNNGRMTLSNASRDSTEELTLEFLVNFDVADPDLEFYMDYAVAETL